MSQKRKWTFSCDPFASCCKMWTHAWVRFPGFQVNFNIHGNGEIDYFRIEPRE